MEISTDDLATMVFGGKCEKLQKSQKRTFNERAALAATNVSTEFNNAPTVLASCLSYKLLLPRNGAVNSHNQRAALLVPV